MVFVMLTTFQVVLAEIASIVMYVGVSILIVPGAFPLDAIGVQVMAPASETYTILLRSHHVS